MDNASLSLAIQLSIAPVFLLTAVAALISALTQRLARVVDRSRVLQAKLSQNDLPASTRAVYQTETRHIMIRGRCINASMIFLVLCALMIGVTILELFFAETGSANIEFSRIVRTTFISGIASFIAALIVLLAEVLVASYSIRWRG